MQNLSEQSKKLIFNLRGLEKATVKIVIDSGIPVYLDMYDYLPVDGLLPFDPLTNEELYLINQIKELGYGEMEIEILNGQWTGTLLPGTHKKIKL